MSLVYLLASLPMLEFDVTPRVTSEGFLAGCREQLPPADAEIVAAVLAGRETNHPFARTWREAENLLRNAIARERGRRLGAREAERWLRPATKIDLALAGAVAAAFQKESPLEREQALDHIRWRNAESMAGYDTMGFNALLAYACKLAIAERRAQLDKGRGLEEFDTRARLPDALASVARMSANDDME